MHIKEMIENLVKEQLGVDIKIERATMSITDSGILFVPEARLGRIEIESKTLKRRNIMKTKSDDIPAIRKKLAIMECRGRLSDNQQRALKATKGISVQKLTDEQKEQIRNIYSDVLEGKTTDRYSSAGE